MIPILPATAWREFRGAAANRGQNHTTHRALIADPTGRAHKCFVKASPSGNPMVLTESIAWMIAGGVGATAPRLCGGGPAAGFQAASVHAARPALAAIQRSPGILHLDGR